MDFEKAVNLCSYMLLVNYHIYDGRPVYIL